MHRILKDIGISNVPNPSSFPAQILNAQFTQLVTVPVVITSGAHGMELRRLEEAELTMMPRILDITAKVIILDGIYGCFVTKRVSEIGVGCHG